MDFTVIGMGLAALGFGGIGMGMGYMFGKAIETIGRQPMSSKQIMPVMWIAFALIEALALYGIVIAFMIFGIRK